jgi:LysR family transcriptional regulator, hydrogen peroxide-inducible genes activator
MTLTQLQYIVAVDTYRNFVKAAESCHVTQPTLSMQIQKLEDTLGVQLFDRNKQPVIPTQLGEAIIKQARIALNESEKIQEIILNMKDSVQGHLRLGIIPTLAPYLLPVFVPHFMSKYKDVHLTIVEKTTQELVDLLKSELIDCALMASPVGHDDFYEKPLFYETFLAYLHPKHPLFKKSKLDLTSLKGLEVWLLNEGHCLRNQIISLCKDKTHLPSGGRINYETGSLETLIKMVDKEGGLTILPELATKDLGKKQQLKLRPFSGDQPSREIGLYTHRAFPKQKLLKAFEQSLLECLPDEIKSATKKKVIAAM